jgi:hypothetical protein
MGGPLYPEGYGAFSTVLDRMRLPFAIPEVDGMLWISTAKFANVCKFSRGISDFLHKVLLSFWIICQESDGGEKNSEVRLFSPEFRV